MATRSLTVSTMEHGAQPCSGHVPHEDICCQLDCLVQPRFFCGQLLTDQDLTALVGWAQAKLRLVRYRDGWGVVCGLEVRCNPEQAGHILVEPGYAVSCCGDDIVVYKPTPFDVSQACRVVQDPCSELRATEQAANEPELQAVDLYICYDEEEVQKETAFGRSVCRQVSRCEPSRVRESFALYWQPVVNRADPVKARAENWHADYSKCLGVVASFRDEFDMAMWNEEQEKIVAEAQAKSGRRQELQVEILEGLRRRREQFAKDIRGWLLDHWIANNPLHQFCFVPDWVCTMGPDRMTSEPNLAAVLFWLVQDCRNAYLMCRCHTCSEGHGVPLARIWLRTTEHRGKRECRIAGIDAYPPYRRSLSPACWPAPLGDFNLGQWMWHRVEETCTALAQLGVHVMGYELFDLSEIETVKDLERELNRDLFVDCRDAVTVQYLDVDQTLESIGLGKWLGPTAFGKRVVGFRTSRKPTRYEPPPPVGEEPEVPREEMAPAQQDDLTRLKYIGEVRARALRDRGITSFWILIETPDDTLKEVLPGLGDTVLKQIKEQAADFLE